MLVGHNPHSEQLLEILRKDGYNADLFSMCKAAHPIVEESKSSNER